MNLEQERPFVCSAPGCSQVSVCVLGGGGGALACRGRTCLPTGRQLSLGGHACRWLFVLLHQDILKVPLTVISIITIFHLEWDTFPHSLEIRCWPFPPITFPWKSASRILPARCSGLLFQTEGQRVPALTRAT